MIRHLACSIFAGVLMLSSIGMAQKPPEKLVFKSKPGDVTFLHQKHVERAGGDCATCHPKLWPQSSAAPLNYKPAIHRTAETKKLSCAAAGCHVEGGKAFASKGKCKSCHGTK